MYFMLAHLLHFILKLLLTLLDALRLSLPPKENYKYIKQHCNHLELIIIAQSSLKMTTVSLKRVWSVNVFV